MTAGMNHCLRETTKTLQASVRMQRVSNTLIVIRERVGEGGAQKIWTMKATRPVRNGLRSRGSSVDVCEAYEARRSTHSQVKLQRHLTRKARLP